MGFVTIGIIPRVLGPEMYGNYGFLTTFYTRTTKFLKLGFSSAYSTKLSSRPEETKLIGFYFYYILVFIFLLFLITFLPVRLELVDILLPGQEINWIYYASILAGLQFIFNSIQTTQDSLGNTVLFEKIIILQSVTVTLSILLLYNFEMLTIKTLLINHCIVSILCIFIGIYSFNIIRLNILENLYLKKNIFIKYSKEFLLFSHPLIIHGLVALIVTVGDRWLLQFYHGSEEQGHFTLAFKLAGVLLLFSTAISTVLSRDMAYTYNKKGNEDLKTLIVRYLPLIYFLTSFFSVFVSCHAETFTSLIGGDSFVESTSCVSILVLYPINQICGQLCVSVFLAIQDTKKIRDIGIIMGITGFILSLCTVSNFGLNLGAIGISLKMILVQFILYNIYIFIICKIFNIKKSLFIINQLTVLSTLFIFCFFLKILTKLIITDDLVCTFISGLLFTILSISMFILSPKYIMPDPYISFKLKSLVTNYINIKYYENR